MKYRPYLIFPTLLAIVLLTQLDYSFIWESDNPTSRTQDPGSRAASRVSASAAVGAPLPELSTGKEALSNGAGGHPGIGSEGYGSHVVRALESGSSSELVEALGWLNSCRRVDEMLEVLYKGRDENRATASTLKPMIADAMAEQRRCQTVTADIAALRIPIAEKALQLGAMGAAHEYMVAIGFRVPGRLKAQIKKALRLDAEALHIESVHLGVLFGNDLGFSGFEQHIFAGLHKELRNGPSSSDGMRIFDMPAAGSFQGGLPKLSEAEMLEVQQEVQDILRRNSGSSERRAGAVGSTIAGRPQHGNPPNLNP